MKRQLALFAALALACGTPVVYNGMTLGGFEAVAQTKATGADNLHLFLQIVGGNLLFKSVNDLLTV